MDRLRRLLSDIAAQMSVLTVSQRVAVGLCAALIVGSLLWLMQWSTTPDLVQLTNQEFTYDQLDSAEGALKANGLRYDIKGPRIYVRAADKHNALRLLHSAQALPEGSLFDMHAVVTDPNPFISPDARKTAETYAKGNELAKIIATYPFVIKASVMINEQTRRRLGVPNDVPTASVVATLSPSSEMTAEIVEGFAKLVAGAVAGLQPHNVYITDARTGRSHGVPHPDDALSLDYLGIVKKREQYLRQKIMDKLAYIPGVTAQVSLELDTSKSIKHKNTYDEPQPKTESSKTSETSSGSAATESGVQANLGQAITAAGGGQTSSSEDSAVENYEPKLRVSETIEQLPFATKRVTATVSIPRSFIASVYAAKNPDAAEPKDADPAFAALRDNHVARVKKSVERIVLANDPDDVEVDVYPDMEWSTEGGVWSRTPGGMASADGQAGMVDAAGMLSMYGPQAGLGLLAMMSMFMMLRVVRNSADVVSRRRHIAGETRPRDDDETVLTVDGKAVGEAELSDSFLTAKEVDDDTVRHHELSAEVSRMVQEDPEGAANLIRRWIEAD